ncbi:hypothetical protein [Clostridium sp.]|uniref:crAss001_48 related protein n=1 Tax=Clostridium sp. TaxID=1506 RepID=UPI0025B8C9B4|nr:hypothetical protein [Clostridium sp.]
MELERLIELMKSEDYKDRFRAEYYQLEDRIDKLANMLEKYKAGTLNFTPSCSYDLLNGQLKSMLLYLEYLTERAEIEGIEL